MIRRKLIDDRHWVLITQGEHARLACEVARHWQSEFFPLAEARDEVLWAVAHHDDGWQAFDRQDSVLPERGVPREFLEMETVDATAIWTASIEAAAERGPIACYAVAGHFRFLAQRYDAWRRHSPAALAAGEGFLQFANDAMQRAATVWDAMHAKSIDPNWQTIPQAAEAHVRFFDAVSLWLCCAERQEPGQITGPNGLLVTLNPIGPTTFTVSPWQFSKGGFTMTAVGRRIPVKFYASADEIDAAFELWTETWRLVPA